MVNHLSKAGCHGPAVRLLGMRHLGLAALLVSVALAVGAQPTMVGTALPAFTGEDLAGAQVTLPGAARGRVALIAFGFSYDSRAPVEAWTAHARTTWGAEAQFTWYQVPMIGGFGRLAKPFITGGMRKETEPRYRANAVTVFGGTGPWKARLGVGDEKLAYLVLLDREGVVRWRYSGLFNPATAAELDAQVRTLLTPPPVTPETATDPRPAGSPTPTARSSG